MKFRSLLTASVLLIMSNHSYAFFCPNNFQQIEYGDAIDKVEQACGKPAKITKKDAPDNSPQQWDYYIQQSGTTLGYSANRATIKTQLAFDKTGKVANISMNNVSTGSASMCGTNIKIGMSREQVESLCGKPGFINKQAQQETQTTDKNDDANKVIEYQYNSTPPVTLIFEKGKLTGKK